jgi:hypothetical protein
MATHPLAILVAGDLVQSVLIRETLFGFDYRPDDFVLRLNPSATSTDSGTLDFYVTQYGVPQSGMTLAISQAGSISDQGGGSTTGPVENIPIPDIGVPESALTFPISTTTEIVTDTAGIAALTLTGANPGSPRLLPANLDPKGSIINPPYMDGQIYVVLYSLNSTELAAVPADVLQYQNQQYQMLDGIYVHVRDAYTAHEPITWYDDVLPIFQQSSNLYPVMSKRLVKLADYDDVAANRAIISLAFSLPDSDPNYMPVTRDMSPAKHDMILKWLNAKDADGKYTLLKGTPPEPSITATKIMAATPAAASPQPTELSDRTARLRRLSLAKSGGNPDA